MSHHPLLAVLGGVRGALNVAAVTALAPGGVHNELPPSPVYPCIRIRSRGKPVGPIAATSIWDVEVEAHIYSAYRGDTEALQIAEAVSTVLDHQALTLTGWTVIHVSLEDLFPAGDEDINGVVVTSWVLPFRIQCERTS